MMSRTGGQSGSRTGKDSAYRSKQPPPIPDGVHESPGGVATNPDIKLLLTDIVSRLDRIEEKIDENVYPPESAIRPECIKKIKKARTDIKKGKGKTYNSIDDFFKEIEA